MTRWVPRLGLALVVSWAVGCTAATSTDPEGMGSEADASSSTGDDLVDAACPPLSGPSYSCGGNCQVLTAPIGSVVSMGGIDSLNAPTPALVGDESDRALLFSDSPEEPKSSGLLARAALPAGPARLYLYHLNGASASKKLVVVMENDSEQDVHIDIERFVVAEPAGGFMRVGKDTTSSFLAAQSDAKKTVPAHQAALLLTTLDSTTISPGRLAHAIVDVTLDGPLTAHVLFLAPGDDALSLYDTVAALPLDANHQRGTFAGADRSLRLPSGCELSSGDGAARIRLGANSALTPLPTGLDEITAAPQDLLGHYGYFYTVTVSLDQDSGPMAMLLNPRGGSYAGAVSVSGGEAGDAVIDVPASQLSLSSNAQAVVIDRVSPGATWTVTWTAPGASNLPVDLVAVPLDP